MTFWAVNKKLYDDAIEAGNSEEVALNLSLCFSIDIMHRFKHIFNKDRLLISGHKEFYGYDRGDRKAIKKEKWTFVDSYPKILNGKQFLVRSFFTPADNETRQNIVDLKDPTVAHKIAQDILLAEFIQNNLKVKYYNMNYPLKFFDYVIKNHENYLEQTRKLEVIDDSKLYKNTRIADFLIEFHQMNPKFGKGIVIEIYNTESEKSILEKKSDWNNAGYSYCAMDIKDFNLRSEQLKKDRVIILNACFETELENLFVRNKLKESETASELMRAKQIINKYEKLIEDMMETEETRITEIVDKLDERLKIIKESVKIIEQKEDCVEEFKKETLEQINKFSQEKKVELDDSINEYFNNFETAITKHIEERRKEILKKIVELNQSLESNQLEEHSLKLDKYYDKLKYFEDNIGKITQELEKAIFRSCSKTKTECLGWIKGKCDVYVNNKMHEIADKRL